MITNFKLFESTNEPKIGDFAIIEYEFLNSYKIGTIKGINKMNHYPYRIEIEDPKLQSGKFTDVYNMDEILYWSNNKEELEKSTKFNI